MAIDPYYGFYSSGTYARPAATSTSATSTSTVTGGSTSATTSNNIAQVLKAETAAALPGETANMISKQQITVTSIEEKPQEKGTFKR